MVSEIVPESLRHGLKARGAGAFDLEVFHDADYVPQEEMTSRCMRVVMSVKFF